MNRAELSELVASNCGISKAKAREVVQYTFDKISEHLRQTGESFQIKDFGVFKVKSKDERTGRNPATGETITIPAKRVVKFHMSKTMRDAI